MDHFLCSYFHFFPSFLIPSSICDKKGKSIVISNDSCAHSQGGKFHRGDANIKGEKTHFYKKTLFCFVFQYVCFLVCSTLWQFVWHCYLYGALSLFLYLYFVVLIASCLYVGYAYIFFCFVLY